MPRDAESGFLAGHREESCSVKARLCEGQSVKESSAKESSLGNKVSKVIDCRKIIVDEMKREFAAAGHPVAL